MFSVDSADFGVRLLKSLRFSLESCVCHDASRLYAASRRLDSQFGIFAIEAVPLVRRTNNMMYVRTDAVFRRGFRRLVLG